MRLVKQTIAMIGLTHRILSNRPSQWFFRYPTVLFYVCLLYLIQILKPISIQYLTLFAEEYFGVYSIFV